MVPVTVVVAAAGVLIKEAVLLARRIVGPRNPQCEPGLGVVTGAQAVRILRVEQTIVVIIQTVAALIQLPLAGRGIADRGSCIRPNHHAPIPSQREVRSIRVDRHIDRHIRLIAARERRIAAAYLDLSKTGQCDYEYARKKVLHA